MRRFVFETGFCWLVLSLPGPLEGPSTQQLPSNMP